MDSSRCGREDDENARFSHMGEETIGLGLICFFVFFPLLGAET